MKKYFNVILAAIVVFTVVAFDTMTQKDSKKKPEMSFLYEDATGRHYMNNETFEDVTLPSNKKVERKPFYDGEGNVIPDHIVRLYVMDHFVQTTKAEQDSIRKYFYFYE